MKRLFLRLLKKIIIVTVVVVTPLAGVWMYLPSGGELRARALTASYATEVFDRQGQYIGLLSAPNSSHGPHTRVDDVPDALIKDLVAIEGMVPLGFSPTAFIRAATGEGGGSTISQQVYRTITGDDAPTIRRKLVEMVGAVQLSLSFTREEILELYLNQIQWTDSRYSGIAVAARQGFNKRPGELRRQEWLVLMSALPLPSVRGDYDERSTGKIRPPYEQRLDLLHEKGRFTAEEYRNLETLPAPNPPSYSDVPLGLFLDRVAARLDSLGAEGTAQALEVKTTLSLDVQQAAHRHLQNVETGHPTFLMLNGGQEVVSYYAGNPRGGFDPLQSTHSLPSSRMKPIVYASFAEQLVEEKGYSASGILQTEMPASIRIGNKVVRDEGVQHPILQEALAQSYNAPAYHAITEVGPEKLTDFAGSLGLKVPPLPSVALGATPVSEVNLASAYSSLLLRGGHPANPAFIRSIRCRRTGDVLYKHDKSSSSNEPLVTETTVDVLRQALRVAAFTGTSEGLTKQSESNRLRQMRDLYVKTGTSPSDSDYRYLGATGVFGEYAFSLTVQGQLHRDKYASGVAVPAARRVLNGVCGLNDIGC